MSAQQKLADTYVTTAALMVQLVVHDPFAIGSVESRQRVLAKLNRLERAVMRVHTGCFGTCQGCGRPIGPERLHLIPDTVLCVVCQRQSEQNIPTRPVGEK